MGFSPTPVGLHLPVLLTTRSVNSQLSFISFFRPSLLTSQHFPYLLFGVIRHSSPFVSHDWRAERCTYTEYKFRCWGRRLMQPEDEAVLAYSQLLDHQLPLKQTTLICLYTA